MKIWQSLKRRLKKYENLANFETEINPSPSHMVLFISQEASGKFYQIFILFLSCVRSIFHVFQIFILFLSPWLRASPSIGIII